MGASARQVRPSMRGTKSVSHELRRWRHHGVRMDIVLVARYDVYRSLDDSARMNIDFAKAQHIERQCAQFSPWVALAHR